MQMQQVKMTGKETGLMLAKSHQTSCATSPDANPIAPGLPTAFLIPSSSSFLPTARPLMQK